MKPESQPAKREERVPLGWTKEAFVKLSPTDKAAAIRDSVYEMYRDNNFSTEGLVK